jgi:hypothetical protein
MCRICKVKLLRQTANYKRQYKNHEHPVLYLHMILRKYYQNQEVNQIAFMELYLIVQFSLDFRNSLKVFKVMDMNLHLYLKV